MNCLLVIPLGANTVCLRCEKPGVRSWNLPRDRKTIGVEIGECFKHFVWLNTKELEKEDGRISFLFGFVGEQKTEAQAEAFTECLCLLLIL